MPESEEDKKWEYESAADTLIKAEEIKSDKPLLKEALKILRKRMDGANKLLTKK